MGVLKSEPAHLPARVPEISTVIGAVRAGPHMMALGDIFGTNIFDIGLIFVFDVAHGGPAVLNEVGAFSVVAALLGVLLTLVYVAGLVERRDKTIGWLGTDSSLVVVLYAGGLGILWFLR